MTSKIDALLVNSHSSDARAFQSLANALEVGQLNIHYARRFPEAIATLETTPIDIVLLDVGSVTNALSSRFSVDRIRELRLRMPQVAVVAIGNTCDRTTAPDLIQAGAQDYLIKRDLLSAERRQKLGDADISNTLLTALRHAIQRDALSQQRLVSQARYELAAKSLNDAIWDWDLRQQTIYYSNPWQAILGLENKNLTNSPTEWLSRIHPEDQHYFKQQLRAHLAQGHTPFECAYRMRHHDNTYRWILCRGNSLVDQNNEAYRIVGSHIDITPRKSLENALHREKEIAQAALQSISEAIITTDRKGYIQDFNPAAERLTGWSQHETHNKPITDICKLVHSTNRRPLSHPAAEAIAKGQAVTLAQQSVLISDTGEEFSVVVSTAPIRSKSGNIVGAVTMLRNVTAELDKAHKLAWRASHDPLTHLNNRDSFVESLTHAIEGPQQHVLCYLDLDHFKVVNDTCGHAAGDQLLKQIADLWRHQIRSSDVLARLGGDEFGLLLYSCDMAQATHIAEAFCKSIRNFRFSYSNKIFNIGVSIGMVSLTPELTSSVVDVNEIVALADAACYEAKLKGRNRIHIYTQSYSSLAPGKTQWQSRLTQALSTNQFCLHQQAITATSPQVQTTPRQEILLRLQDDTSDQLLAPMGFIPTAERYQMMDQIDRWVLDHVLQQMSNTASNTTYSINLSAASLNDDSFTDFVEQQLDYYDIEACHLCFEIAETAIIANLHQAAIFTAKLKQLGCQTALDNFGSGLAALSYLKDLSINYLKIDGHFIKEAPTDATIYAMLKAIQQMSRAMNIQTIAKSVESPDALETAKVLGMDYVQGYEISQPQPLPYYRHEVIAAA